MYKVKKLATCPAGALLLLSMTVHGTMATSSDDQQQAIIVQPSPPEVEYLAAALAAVEEEEEEEEVMESDNAVESPVDIVAAERNLHDNTVDERQLYGRRDSKDSRSSGRRNKGGGGGRVRKNDGGKWASTTTKRNGGGRWGGRGNGRAKTVKNNWGQGAAGWGGNTNKWEGSSGSSWSSGKSGKSKGSKAASSSSSWDGPSRSGWDHAPPVWDAPAADWGGDAWDGISGWKDPTMMSP